MEIQNNLPKTMYEDIHISDNELYQSFLEDISNGNYSSALNILSTNDQLQKKAMSADNINLITSNLVYLQNLNYNNTGLQKDRIEVSTSPPASITSGTVWYQIIE